jgi:hypothetical protein
LAIVYFVVVVVAVATCVVDVVVDTARLIVKYLDAHLAVDLVEEVHQAVDIDVMGASELFLDGVEVHLAFPSNKTSTVHQQKVQLASHGVTSNGSQPARNSANLSGSFFLPKGSLLMRVKNSKYL